MPKINIQPEFFVVWESHYKYIYFTDRHGLPLTLSNNIVKFPAEFLRTEKDFIDFTTIIAAVNDWEFRTMIPLSENIFRLKIISKQ